MTEKKKPEVLSDGNVTSHRKNVVSLRTGNEKAALTELREVTEELLPKFGDEVWHRNTLVTMSASVTSRILYLDNLYRKIIDVPGVICEFGVQWGATLTQLINLRSIHEPFNHSRTICGFDTFEGFVEVHKKKDGNYQKGDLFTQENHEAQLHKILSLIESFSPLAQIEKFQLIKGDASHTIDQWLEENPHAIISMAIFDMDLYEPTKAVLEKIIPRLTKGSVLAFDELSCRMFPGETLALNEVIGLKNIRLYRSPLHTFGAWAIYGE